MGSHSTVSYYGSSYSSSICYISTTEIRSPENENLIISGLTRPEKLSSVMEFPNFNLPSDAVIVVNGNREIPIHSSFLSNKSLFFKNLFSGAVDGKGFRKFQMKELGKDFDVGFEAIVVILDYLYTGKVECRFQCEGNGCSQSHIKREPLFILEVLYASFIFQIHGLVVYYQILLPDDLKQQIMDLSLKLGSDELTSSEISDRHVKSTNEASVHHSFSILGSNELTSSDISDRHVKSTNEASDHHSFSILGSNELTVCDISDRHVKSTNEVPNQGLKCRLKRHMRRFKGCLRNAGRKLWKGLNCCKSF